MLKLFKQCKYLVFCSLYYIILTYKDVTFCFWHTLYIIYASVFWLEAGHYRARVANDKNFPFCVFTFPLTWFSSWNWGHDFCPWIAVIATKFRNFINSTNSSPFSNLFHWKTRQYISNKAIPSVHILNASRDGVCIYSKYSLNTL